MDDASYQQSDAGFVIALAMALVFLVLTAQFAS
jgi:multidrug efflux pump subunit AcrB